MTVCGEKVTGVCIAAKCPHFKRCCPVIWDKYGKIKPKTNEEWFCGLSTEEKVNALLNLHEKVRRKMRTDIGGENSFYNGNYYRKWLKEIHNHETD